VNPRPVSRRPLCTMERSCWHVNRVASHNLVTMLEVEGPLEEEPLRRGLDALQRRNPLLGVRILGEGRDLWFCREEVPEIPLRIVEGSPEGWCRHADRELNTALPVHTGPPARCTVLRHGGSRHTILFTLLHAVGDGRAAFVLLRDLLGSLAGIPGGASREEDRGLPPALFDRLPVRVKGLRGSLRLGKMAGREFLGYLREGGIPRRLPLDSRPPHFLRWTRIVPIRMDREVTGRLVERAKREDASVHSALCAAGLLAVSGVMARGRSRVLSCTSAVNMRDRVDPAIGDEVGLYVSVLWVGLRVVPGMPFWEVARAVRKKLAGRIQRGDPAVVAGSGSLFLSLLERLPGENRSRRIVRTAERMMYNFRGTGVSSVGNLEMPDRVGSLTLRSLSFAGSLVNLGYFLAVANTFQGCLHINYLYNEPMITRPRVMQLVETAERLLRGCVE